MLADFLLGVYGWFIFLMDFNGFHSMDSSGFYWILVGLLTENHRKTIGFIWFYRKTSWFSMFPFKFWDTRRMRDGHRDTYVANKTGKKKTLRVSMGGTWVSPTITNGMTYHFLKVRWVWTSCKPIQVPFWNPLVGSPHWKTDPKNWCYDCWLLVGAAGGLQLE